MMAGQSLYDFDGIAGGYDRCNHLFSLGIDHRWRRRLVWMVRPGAGCRVLDLCCGTGDLAFSFLRNSAAASVVGLDISGEMLECARAKQARLAGKRWMTGRPVAWCQADAAATGLASGEFDIVTCAFGVRNLPGRAAALAEVARLLRPGGQLAVLEFSLPRHRLIRAPYRWYLGRVMPLLGRLVLGDSQPLAYLARSIEWWDGQVDFAAELRQAGLVFDRSDPFTGGIVTLWQAHKPERGS